MEKDLLKYTVEEKDDGVKLDSILKNKLNLSRRLITGLKKNQNIFLNGNKTYSNVKVKKGDEVSVNLIKKESQDIEPQFIPIDVRYEDNDLLIVNKQPGIVVHPTKGHQEGTLSNGIIYYWRQRGEDTIVRLVNRLDRDTSGLIMIAKNQFCHQAMAKQLESNSIDKIYMCVVHGSLSDDEGTIDMPIDRPSYESIKREVMAEGQRSITHYKVMDRFKSSTSVGIKLETGRTHQIRVHMSQMGHPLYGDTLYGTEDDMEMISRQALHAQKLSFNHPRTGQRITVCSDIPEDIRLLVSKLKNED